MGDLGPVVLEQSWLGSVSTHLPAVLHDVHPKLEDVPTAHLPSWALLRPFAQSLVVDKCPVTGLGILHSPVNSKSLSDNVHLEVKFSVFIPKQRVITR